MKKLIFLIAAILVSTGVGRAVSQSIEPPTNDGEVSWDGTLRRIRVPILMYHYVSDLPADADEVRADLTVVPNMFRAHVRYMQEQGYNPISMYALDNALQHGETLPPKPVILTFDDGYIDHYATVFPILQEYGMTATFFIITGLADDRVPGYMNWDQIGEMAATGMSMESHTKTHRDLRNRDYDFLIYEFLGSLESLSAHIGNKPHMFAYPVGRYDELTLNVISQTSIWRAVTTQHGASQTTDNRLEMPRIRIHGVTGVNGLASLLETR